MRTLTRMMSLLTALLVLATANGLAQDAPYKPVILVAVNSYDDLIGNLKFVGSTIEDQNFVDKVSLLVGNMLDAQGLKLDQVKGIDPQKPWGFAIVSDGLDLIPFSFAPVTDLKAFLASLAPLLGEAEETDDGFYEVSVAKLAGFIPAGPLLAGPDITVYVKERDGWALGVQLPEHVDVVPDPAEMLGALTEKNQLVLQLNMVNLPEAVQGMMADQFPMLEVPGLAAAPQPLPDESDAQFALRKAATEMMTNMIGQVLRDSEEITIGWSIDKDARRVVGDFYCRPVEGSDLQNHIADMQAAQTRFAPLLEPEGAVLTLGMTAPLDAPRAEGMQRFVDAYHAAVRDSVESSEAVQSDEERQTFHELTDVVGEVFSSTVVGGNIDVAVRLTGGRETYTLVGGMLIEEVERTKELLNRVAELAEDDPGFDSVQLEIDQVGGVPIHALKLARPEALGALGQMAKEPTLHVAFEENIVWWAIGPKGLSELKSLIGAEPTAAKPMQVSVRLREALPMLLPPDDQQMMMIGAVLGFQLREADLMTMVLEAQEDGLHGHAELEEGYMRMFGAILPFLGPLLSGDGGGGGLPLGPRPSRPSR